MAHVDTLGGMISTIKPNGRITITPIGGLRAENCEAENCRIYSRFSGVYSGTLQLCNASIHVNGSYGEKLSRGLGDVYKRQHLKRPRSCSTSR